MARKRPTQKAVAEVAKVSQGMVSQVLSGGRNIEVAAKTRDRIIRIARDMGYLPSKAGDPGYRSSTRKIWAYIRPVVTRNHHNEHWIYDSYAEFYDRIQAELVEAAFDLNYTLIVRPYSEPMELTHWIIESGASGVFWHARDDELLNWIVKRYPVVEINRRMLPNTDGIFVDQEAIINMGMQHLVEHGHRNIAFLPNSPFTDKLWSLRIKAYREFAQNKGLPVYEEFLQEEAGHEFTMERLLAWLGNKDSEGPTALIASDKESLIKLKDLRVAGYRVPDDISLLGIDNISACAYVDPPLSSIESPFKGLAGLATGMMADRMKKSETPFRKVAITPRIIERASIRPLETRRRPESAATKR